MVKRKIGNKILQQIHIKKEIRVFVSSTFLDMQQERDILIKQVFPQLKTLCLEKGLNFNQVDLRWGIPMEEEDNNQVLPTCLREIDNCRPFFIGMLGERYGSLFKEEEDYAHQYPWLTEEREKSFTELEILYGVLDNESQENFAFFYLRDPAYIKTLPVGKRHEFYDIKDEDFQQKQGKLSKLKDRIKQSQYVVRDLYQTPEEFGRLVLEDLKQAIEEVAPKEAFLFQSQHKTLLHQSMADEFTRNYIKNQQLFQRMEQYLHEKSHIVIYGEPGIGKSALLANWGQEMKKNKTFKRQNQISYMIKEWFPDIFNLTVLAVMAFHESPPLFSNSIPLLDTIMKNIGEILEVTILYFMSMYYFLQVRLLFHNLNKKNYTLYEATQYPLIFLHFTGAGSDSVFEPSMLKRFLQEYNRRFELYPKKENKVFTLFNNEIQSAFYQLLNKKHFRGKIRFLIDDIDRLDMYNEYHEQYFYAKDIPANAQFIVTTSNKNLMENLNSRNWNVLEIPPLTIEQKKEILENYTKKTSKKLVPSQIETIIQNRQTDSPQYLHLLLEELRILGDPAEVNEKLTKYLTAKTTTELFKFIIERWEQEYPYEMVKKCLQYIFCSKRGVKENDLLYLLGENDEPFPDRYWIPFFQAIEPYVTTGINFGLVFNTVYLADAVEQKYFKSLKNKKMIHIQLYNLFKSEGRTKLEKMDEIPYQLYKAELWEELHDYLKEVDTLADMFVFTGWDPLFYWRELEKFSSYRVIKTYKHVIENPAKIKEVNLYRFLYFLQFMNRPKEVLKFIENLTRQKKLKTHDQLSLLCSKGKALVDLKEKEQAKTILSELKYLSKKHKTNFSKLFIQELEDKIKLES